MACGQFGDRRPIVHPELLRLRGAPRARAIDGPGLRADRPLISPSGHLDGEVPDAARGDEQPAARVGGIRLGMARLGYGTAGRGPPGGRDLNPSPPRGALRRRSKPTRIALPLSGPWKIL